MACQAIVNTQKGRRLRWAVVPPDCVLGNSVNFLQLPEAEVRGVGVVRQYTTGQWFGELALVTNQPRKATVRAVTSCTTLRLQRTDFERLIGKLALEIGQRGQEANPVHIVLPLSPNHGQMGRAAHRHE